MRMLILGVGDAFTRRHFTTSALIEGPAGLVMIDCGDLIHRGLASAAAASNWPGSLDASRIDDIVLTHLHGDHANGLESFGFYRRVLRAKGGDSPVPRLHTTPVVADRLWSRLAPAMEAPMLCDRPSTLADYFDVRLISPEREAEIAGLKVRCRFTKHPIPTIGLRISHGGRTLGWSGDTPFEPAHVDWLADASLIVHESNLGPAHTPIASLNALAAALRGKMHLIHLPDDFDPGGTDIRILREGQLLEI